MPTTPIATPPGHSPATTLLDSDSETEEDEAEGDEAEDDEAEAWWVCGCV